MDQKENLLKSKINPYFSMMIDLQESQNNKDFNDLSSEYCFHLAPRKISSWIKDESVNNCYECNNSFSFFRRKHHCRSCGRIFCFYCCNNFIKLPEDIEQFPIKPKEYSFQKTIKKFLSNTDKNSHRVCNKCNIKYKHGEKIWFYIKIIRILDLNLEQIKNLGLVNKYFNKASAYCIANFRDIQYSLCNHKLDLNENKLLWNNRNFLVGHNKWMVQLLKSLNWNDSEKVSIVLDLLTQKKNKNCIQMMCSRHCQKNINISDSIELLNINNIYLKKYLIYCISLVEDNELLCYINSIVNSIKYNVDNELITEFLIDKSIKNKNIRFKVYWCLSLRVNDDLYGNHYKVIRNKFINIINTQNGDKEITEIINCSKIVKLMSGIQPNDDYTQIVKNIVNKYQIFKEEIPNPFNPHITMKNININNMEIKKSNTRPLVFSFENEKNNIEILLKRSDIRKDQIIIDIIKLMDIIIKKEEGIDLNILTYEVIPLDNNYGIIEIVPNSKTLYEIKYGFGMTLQNYILEKNKNLTVDEVRKKFVKSSAAYCIITYLLGIGDRHLENIMVTNDGRLFHIDFEFILGEDPKKYLSSSIRITDDMIETLGGENSVYYKEFQNLCNITYNCLRRHYNIFMNMLLLLQEYSPPIISDKIKFSDEVLKNEIINRFLPGQISKNAELHIIDEINSSYKKNNYKNSLIDTLHYYSKEGINKIFW